MQFVLTRSLGLGSLAIRARLLEPWSHGLVVDSPVHVIDSTFHLGGVRRRSMSDAMGRVAAAIWHEAPLPHEARAREFLYEQLGRRYDCRAIWGWAGAGRDWHDDQAWFCFELIAAAIEAGSDYRFTNRNRVTGRDLQRAASILSGVAS